MKHSSWLMAARPRTLGLSVTPVVVGAALAWAMDRQIHWLAVGAALVASMFIQMGTNLHNDAVDSERGGVTIYQFDAQERFVFYYAHLHARAEGLSEGDVVRQGDVIGYVGRSGNAPVAHLHFEIQRLTPERLWWRAEAMNPYPYLVSGEAPE